VSVGLLLLRILLAALLAGHAAQKLFGWFRGTGITTSAVLFEAWGFRPGKAMVTLAGASELIGSTSIGFGLLTPAGCAVVIGTMIVAASPNLKNGLWAHMGGFEVPVVYGGMAAVIACTGPGRYSLDRAAGLNSLHNAGWSVAAIAVGCVAAVPPLLRRRHLLAASVTPTQGET
jgi:putative oxidoreductase